MKLKSRSKSSGQGIVIVLILVVLAVGAWWYLQTTNKTAEQDARQFSRETVNQLVISYNKQWLDEYLSPQAKVSMAPSAREYLVGRFRQFGAPQQPIQIEETISFDSSLGGLVKYAPKGIFVAHLNYPGQGATLQIATSHPETRWQLDDVTFTPGTAPR